MKKICIFLKQIFNEKSKHYYYKKFLNSSGCLPISLTLKNKK